MLRARTRPNTLLCTALALSLSLACARALGFTESSADTIIVITPKLPNVAAPRRGCLGCGHPASPARPAPHYLTNPVTKKA